MFTKAVGTYTCVNRHGEMMGESIWINFVNEGKLKTKLRAKTFQEKSD